MLEKEQSEKKFPKAERLSSKKMVQELFKKGSSFHAYPIRTVYQLTQNEPPANPQILFSVPKRVFKKAVDRNKIRRRLKESYRSNKFLLTEGANAGDSYIIAFIYTGKEIVAFKELDNKLKSSLLRLKNIRNH